LEHLLFAAYLVLFAWLVTKVPFFKASGLSTPQLIILFLLKVLAGIFYGWIGVYYGEMAKMVDTWAYHYESLNEYQLLLNDPGTFFSSIFQTTYQDGYTRFLASENSWWNDLKSVSFLKILALFNVFSFGNYYINVIFYSFLSFFGPIALYRVVKEVYLANKLVLILALFLFPSFIYWTSGLHKDGFIFLGFALVTYHFYFALKEKNLPLQRLLGLGFGALLILLLRNFLIVVLVPALVAWFLSKKINRSPVLTFSVVYFFFSVLFFTAKYIHPALDFPAATAEKQAAFMQLSGNSAVPVKELQPNFSGFVQNAPHAFVLAALRPFPTDVHHLLSLAAALEMILVYTLLALFFAFPKIVTTDQSFLLFSLFLSFSVLMMIGYSVNFLGAIVRYRSVVIPFLMVPLVAQIDWQAIKTRLLNKY